MSETDEELISSVRKSSIRRYLERIWNRMLCEARIHTADLQVDEHGLYRICEKCGFYQRTELWKKKR